MTKRTKLWPAIRDAENGDALGTGEKRWNPQSRGGTESLLIGLFRKNFPSFRRLSHVENRWSGDPNNGLRMGLIAPSVFEISNTTVRPDPGRAVLTEE